jgi:TPR repeat protein
LVKLECLEIILFNALAFFIRKSKIRATTAVMHEKGKGVKQDDLKTLKFYQKACDLNDDPRFKSHSFW